MSTREQTIADATQIFEHAEYPSGLNKATAWLGIYQTLLWYEPVNLGEFKDLPHIIEADKLRPSVSAAKKSDWTKPRAWQRRALAFGTYLAEQLNCPADKVSSKTDLLMKQADYAGMQRQNSLGIAFPGLVKHILEKFGTAALSYQTEVEATKIFPGIEVPGRSSTPSIDLLATDGNIPHVVISAKWSLRHDRVNDITNECPVYKAAYQRIYRQTRHAKLLYYVVTNEFDPSRLNKVLADTCVDGIIHVHKAAITGVCRLNGRLTRLIDLADFISTTSSW